MSDISERISAILKRADSIQLAEMDGVSLLNRIDKKYVLHVNHLPQILEQILDHYFVLDIKGVRTFSYKTVYFDTPDYQFYKDHHNGLTNRIKVRCRQYIESDDTFFEIKRKYQGYRTDKYRKNIDSILSHLGAEEYDQVKLRYKKHEIEDLGVTLNNFFHRITLVSKTLTERATIDFDLAFSNDEKNAVVDDIAIIEVKQGKHDDRSPIVQVLKKEKVYPNSISKYTYGLLLVGRQVKYNAFKKILRKVNKIQTSDGVHRHLA